MPTNNIIKLLREKIKLLITVAIISLLSTATLILQEKIYFAWHSDHYFEMLFQLERSKMDNKDGDQLYVIMEDLTSGKVKYVCDILETAEGKQWVFIYEIWIMYPLRIDDHGVKYVYMEHEGDQQLFPK